MSEENKKCEEEKKCCCVCKFIKCENCQKFLIVALGTFIGMFCAMSLFFALNKPPMMIPGQNFGFGAPMMEKDFGHKHHHFDKGFKHHKHGFHKHFDMEKPAPDEFQKPEIEE